MKSVIPSAQKNGYGVPKVTLDKLHVFTITRKGAVWLRANGYDEHTQGKLQTGLTKQREAHHDSRLYVLAQTEIARLNTTGCTILAVHTDKYLKGRLHAVTHKIQQHGLEKPKAQRLAAESLDLPMIDGKAMLPDVRIVYERNNGQQSFIDLELISDTYSKQQIAGKISAGFHNYAPNAAGGFKQQGGGSVWAPDHMARLFGR